MILVQPGYFAPIIQYAQILKSSKIVFEVEDNYQKQTYRNRCFISGANGKQLLNIPIKHSKTEGKTKTKDILIDYDTSAWHQTHLKSLQAAYRSSPFYEYYEDEIKSIYKKKHKFLLDLNLDTHNFVMEMMQENIPYTQTHEFLLTSNSQDYRHLINAKKTVPYHFPDYIQMFDEKHGFLKNLSILDLLFMEGPASYKYLENVGN